VSGVIVAIEEQRAKEREKKGGKVGGKGSGNVSTPLSDNGKARDKAAERLDAGTAGLTNTAVCSPRIPVSVG